MTTVPDDDGMLLHYAADLLYERDDPRSQPWPPAAILGLIRSRLRGLGDDLADAATWQRPVDPDCEDCQREVQ